MTAEAFGVEQSVIRIGETEFAALGKKLERRERKGRCESNISDSSRRRQETNYRRKLPKGDVTSTLVRFRKGDVLTNGDGLEGMALDHMRQPRRPGNVNRTWNIPGSFVNMNEV